MSKYRNQNLIRRLKKMNQFTEILPNQVALEILTAPTGNFLMGSLSLDDNYPKDENPLQKVYLLSQE